MTAQSGGSSLPGGRGESRPQAPSRIPDLRDPRVAFVQLVSHSWQGFCVLGQRGLAVSGAWALGHSSLPWWPGLSRGPIPCATSRACIKILAATTQPAARSPGRRKLCRAEARALGALRLGRGTLSPALQRGCKGAKAKLIDVPGLKAPRAEAPAATRPLVTQDEHVPLTLPWQAWVVCSHT